MQTQDQTNGNGQASTSDTEATEAQTRAVVQAYEVGDRAGFEYLRDLEAIAADAAKQRKRKIRKALSERDTATIRVMVATARRAGVL